MNNFISFVVFSTLIIQILGHSFVSSPEPRGNQGSAGTGCVLPSCTGPCFRPASAATTSYPTSRGATITIKWPRNNHPGGFVRFSWAPTAQSDSMTAFDQGVDQFRCFEAPAAACKPGNSNDPNGADGADQTKTSCGSTITVPGYLTDGKWTLQWAWFGGGYFLGDYYSCIDYTVSGGTTSARQNPIFYGGDYANPGSQMCKWFNTDKLHVCGADGCKNGTTGGAPVNGPPANVVIGVSSGAQTGTQTGTSSTATGGLSGSQTGTLSGTPPISGGNEPSSEDIVQCNSDDQCSTGICQSDGYCYVSKSKKLDGGGIAAIVFALLFVAIVGVAVIFVIMNKSEWSNWKPFNKKSGGGGGFS